MKTIKNIKGQAMGELALVIPLLLTMIFGLIVMTMWATAGIVTQQIAHEVARKYAVTMDIDKAKEVGFYNIDTYGYIFIKPEKTDITLSSNGSKATALIETEPKITSLFVFEMDKITRKSSCTFEHVWRENSQYE